MAAGWGGSGKAPEGFSKLEDRLKRYAAQLHELQMKASPNSSNQARQAHLHKILQIEHERSRMIFNIYYQDQEISTQLYRWLLRNKFANEKLIASWKKPGFERLCCLHFVGKAGEAAIKPACICRVPHDCLEEEKIGVACVSCGCTGCSS